MTTDEQKIYFAAQPDPEVFARAVFARKKTHEEYLRNTKLFNLYCKMHWAYFGQEDGSPFDTTAIGRDGANGELHVFKVNHLRSIITGWDSLLGAQRTALEPVPMDGDYESEIQKKRAKAMLDHYVSISSSARLEVIEKETREFACIYGAGWGLQLWNHGIGAMSTPGLDAMGDDAGMPGIPSGDLQAWSLTPLDVFFDPKRKNSRIPWYLCRIDYPKHAAVKRWPQWEEKLLAAQPQTQGDFLDFSLFTSGFEPNQRSSDDEVSLYWFMHDPNEAIELGHQAFLLDAETVLERDDLLYRGRDGNRKMPIERLAVADIPRTPLAYTPAWGLMASQEAADSLSTIELTNQRTFGLGSMTAEKGSDVEPEQVSTGLLLVPFNKGSQPPQVLKFPTTPPEVHANRRDIISEMGMLLGVSGVNRGDASATVDKSGSALAFIDAKALQFSSVFQGANVMWRESFYLSTVCIAQQYMTTERQFEVMGENTALLMKPFAGKDIDRIIRVRVQTVNPLAQTFSGRMQIADTLAERWPNDVKPGDYFRVLEDGSGDFLTRDVAQSERLMDRENELLAMGIGPAPKVPQLNPMTQQPMLGPDGAPMMKRQHLPGKRYVTALITDDHKAHVMRHRCVLDDPSVRDGSTPEANAVLQAALDHIDEHEELARKLTTERPGLLQLTGQQPIFAALPPMGPQPGHPGHPVEPGPKQVDGSPEASVEQPKPAGPGEQPRQPSMPTNPSTGRRAPGPAPRAPQPQPS